MVLVIHCNKGYPIWFYIMKHDGEDPFKLNKQKIKHCMGNTEEVKLIDDLSLGDF